MASRKRRGHRHLARDHRAGIGLATCASGFAKARPCPAANWGSAASSRARRRVQAENTMPDADLNAQREVVEAFLAAARDGDFDRLVAVLDPDVVLSVDLGPLLVGGSREVD